MVSYGVYAVLELPTVGSPAYAYVIMYWPTAITHPRVSTIINRSPGSDLRV